MHMTFANGEEKEISIYIYFESPDEIERHASQKIAKAVTGKVVINVVCHAQQTFVMLAVQVGDGKRRAGTRCGGGVVDVDVVSCISSSSSSSSNSRSISSKGLMDILIMMVRVALVGRLQQTCSRMQRC